MPELLSHSAQEYRSSAIAYKEKDIPKLYCMIVITTKLLS